MTSIVILLAAIVSAAIVSAAFGIFASRYNARTKELHRKWVEDQGGHCAIHADDCPDTHPFTYSPWRALLREIRHVLLPPRETP